ncbi:Nuclease sbcCD subunit D [Slackia heliotrinireducens]|uniref:Nuclease SbcCD subunit D n=1 Tax=Slackia heliotrinireducens (strain ATCC 29202 / DSM 20476 / NCTC 11029 / RHS 1) TaxID=471855 RepID=C7N5B0_SLAHD|nr:exonuclease SbcCD subunit D [Slackia heliotrinireducens]ACV22095.1 exonuclease SbcD [Slackia heliotrinireducens DSM 20476]VEH00092.1 Nuclease sbcCD subunit D [Slackia heliotrinireducens]
MKLLHVSDLHIGKRVHEFPMIEDQRHILAQIVDTIRERDVDALLIAGDIYDKSSPSAEAVALFDDFLCAVADLNVPCLAVAGNHDSQERIAYASRLLASRNVYLSPVFDGAIDHVTLHDEHGPVTFWLIPYLRFSEIKSCFDEFDGDYTDAMAKLIGQSGVNPEERNVALAHQFVTWQSVQPERSDSEIGNIGGVDNIDARAFDVFDYVALGHIHRPQRIGRDTVRYSGSPLKYSISEAPWPKSMPLVTLGKKGSVDFELVPFKPLHDLREIRGPLADLTSPDVVGAADAEDYLHVTLTDEEPWIDAMSRLREHYPNVMRLDYDNAATRSASQAAVSAPGELESMSSEDLFAEFFEMRTGIPLTQAQTDLVHAVLTECGAK